MASRGGSTEHPLHGGGFNPGRNWTRRNVRLAPTTHPLHGGQSAGAAAGDLLDRLEAEGEVSPLLRKKLLERRAEQARQAPPADEVKVGEHPLGGASPKTTTVRRGDVKKLTVTLSSSEKAVDAAGGGHPLSDFERGLNWTRKNARTDHPTLAQEPAEEDDQADGDDAGQEPQFVAQKDKPDENPLPRPAPDPVDVIKDRTGPLRMPPQDQARVNTGSLWDIKNKQYATARRVLWMARKYAELEKQYPDGIPTEKLWRFEEQAPGVPGVDDRWAWPYLPKTPDGHRELVHLLRTVNARVLAAPVARDYPPKVADLDKQSAVTRLLFGPNFWLNLYPDGVDINWKKYRPFARGRPRPFDVGPQAPAPGRPLFSADDRAIVSSLVRSGYFTDPPPSWGLGNKENRALTGQQMKEWRGFKLKLATIALKSVNDKDMIDKLFAAINKDHPEWFRGRETDPPFILGRDHSWLLAGAVPSDLKLLVDQVRRGTFKASDVTKAIRQAADFNGITLPKP